MCQVLYLLVTIKATILLLDRENQRESLCRQKMWLFSGVVKMWHEDLWVTVTSHIHSVGPSSSSQKDLRGNGRNIFWWGIPTRVIVRGFRCFTTLPCSYIKCGILTMWKPLPSYLYSTLKSPRFFPVLRTILIEFVLNLRKFLGPLAWKSSSDSSSGHFLSLSSMGKRYHRGFFFLLREKCFRGQPLPPEGRLYARAKRGL